MSGKSGYCNGSDMLLSLGGKATGHSASHTMTMNTETKDRAVKPKASIKTLTGGLWKNKSVVGLSISISAEGLVFYGEDEAGYKEMLKAWKTGKPIEVKANERDQSEKPYLVGMFIITSLERKDAAGEDSTYSISLENDGEPSTLDESAITEGTLPSPEVP